MYFDFLKLRSQPFSEHASALALWQDQRMDEGLARLEYLVTSGELGLVTGPSGVGKSALLKRFLHQLPSQHCQPVYCHLSHLPANGILKMVVTQLGEAPRRGKERVFEQLLDHAARGEGSLLLVFDEAHLLDGDALTDLRLLISSAMEPSPPVKILLAGQDPLRAMLRRARHADLLNRVSVRYQMRPLTKEQTCRYIDFQISHVGGDARLFDDGVKSAIHDFTGGVPRQINNLATACLLQAASQKVLRIDEALFQQAVGEFQLP